MLSKLVMWAMLIVPWFTMFFMKRESIKRFTPVMILSALLVTITHEMGHALKWWVFLDGIVPWGYITNVSDAYGVFIVATYWVFHFTNGRFWLYMFVNTVLGGLWVFLVAHFLEWIKVFQYLNINEWYLWGIHIILALMLYGFQVWHEKAFKLKT